MLKRFSNSFLILALLNLTACYSNELITKQQLDEKKEELDFRKALIVTTKDYVTYQFDPRFYQIKQDTVYGEGVIVSSSAKTPFNGKIAMNDIAQFEQEQFEGGATVGLILGIAAVTFVVLYLVSLVALEDSIDPD